MPSRSAENLELPFSRGLPAALNPYALALLLVGLALAATLALQTVFVGRPPMFPFFAAVAAAAWFGGRGPGYLASTLALPLGLYFYAASRPDHGLHIRDLLLFLFFGSCAFVGGALNARRQVAEDGLRKAHDALQIKAAELQHSNEALIAEMAERRRTQESLEHTRNELAKVSRLTTMAEMAASIAHEINQPLTAVVTNADTCVRWLAKPDIDEAREAAQRVVRDAEHAAQVVARVRAMVRHALAERTPVSLPTCLDEVLSLLQPVLAKQAVVLRQDIAPDLPIIPGDRIQLQQVFFNLITNALESLSQVTDRVCEIMISAQRTAENTIKIVLRDNGEGFAEDVLPRLFDSFITTKPHGMGMGLAICRGIVEAHGGTLVASPADPSGAQFTITLPTGGETP